MVFGCFYTWLNVCFVPKTDVQEQNLYFDLQSILHLNSIDLDLIETISESGEYCCIY